MSAMGRKRAQADEARKPGAHALSVKTLQTRAALASVMLRPSCKLRRYLPPHITWIDPPISCSALRNYSMRSKTITSWSVPAVPPVRSSVNSFPSLERVSVPLPDGFLSLRVSAFISVPLTPINLM